MKSLFRAPLLGLAAISLSVATANSATYTLLTEGFETSTTASPPAGWNLNTSPGTSTTSIYTGGTYAITGSNALQIDTGPSYEIASTPTIDLTGATTATITFSFVWSSTQATRNFSVDFYNGTSWTTGTQFSGSTGTNQQLNTSYTVTTGFGANNRFRFEGKNAGGGGTHSVYIDNVVITSDIPEPRAALIGGLGLLALLRRRR